MLSIGQEANSFSRFCRYGRSRAANSGGESRKGRSGRLGPSCQRSPEGSSWWELEANDPRKTGAYRQTSKTGKCSQRYLNVAYFSRISARSHHSPQQTGRGYVREKGGGSKVRGRAVSSHMLTPSSDSCNERLIGYRAYSLSKSTNFPIRVTLSDFELDVLLFETFVTPIAKKMQHALVYDVLHVSWKAHVVCNRLKEPILELLNGANTVFTRSAITPPKVSEFGWNLEQCEYIVGGWLWQILGAIRAVVTL